MWKGLGEDMGHVDPVRLLAVTTGPRARPFAMYRRNIQEWYQRATPAERLQGETWYFDAQARIAELAEAYGTSLPRAAAVVAVLSPMVRWERNIEEACMVFEATRTGVGAGPDERIPSMQAFRANQRKALDYALLLTEPDWLTHRPKGPKVGAFWALLAGRERDTAVVVDSIAILAAVGVDPTPFTTSMDAKLYFNRPLTLRLIQDAYRAEAKCAGIQPHAMQATVWLVWRGERDKQ